MLCRDCNKDCLDRGLMKFVDDDGDVVLGCSDGFNSEAENARLRERVRELEELCREVQSAYYNSTVDDQMARESGFEWTDWIDKADALLKGDGHD